MPTPYKGKVRISCIPEVCIKDKARADVTVDPCFICPLSESAIVGLEDELIFSMGSPTGITLTEKATPEMEGGFVDDHHSGPIVFVDGPEAVPVAEKGKKSGNLTNRSGFPAD